MNSRQRIRAAFAFEKTDRVPRYDIFLPGFRRAWHEKAGVPTGDDLAIYSRFDRVDIGTVLADQSGPLQAGARVVERSGSTVVERDSWGRLVMTKEDGFFEKVLEVAIRDKRDVDAVDFTFRPAAPFIDRGGEGFRRLDARFGLVSGVMGLFMGCWRLRGEEQFLVDLAEDEPFAVALVSRMAGHMREKGLACARDTGTMDTAIWVYDEFTSRLGPLISPKVFERVFLPAYLEVFDGWRAEGLATPVLHCDGNSLPLFELLIDAGFRGVQSMAPTAGMWLPDVKKRFGNKLVLIGGMDNIVTLAKGTKGEIEAEARAVFEAALEGGVIVGTHSVDEDIPVENYEFYDSLMRRWEGQ